MLTFSYKKYYVFRKDIPLLLKQSKPAFVPRRDTYPEKRDTIPIPKRYVSRKKGYDTYPFLERKQVSFYLFLRVRKKTLFEGTLSIPSRAKHLFLYPFILLSLRKMQVSLALCILYLFGC